MNLDQYDYFLTVDLEATCCGRQTMSAARILENLVLPVKARKAVYGARQHSRRAELRDLSGH